MSLNSDNPLLEYAFENFAGVALKGARSNQGNKKRNEDGVLLNPSCGFVAIADGADRCPGSAAKVLGCADKRIRQVMDRVCGPDRVLGPGQTLTALTERIRLECNTMLTFFKRTVSCAFTGVQFVERDGQLWGIVIHTGDTRLWAIRKNGMQLEQLTTDNFWMIGKTEQFYQIDSFEIRPGTILLLATDGVTLIDHVNISEQYNSVLRSVLANPAIDIASKLILAQDATFGVNDDASAVTLSVTGRRIGKSEAVLMP